jgi:molybdopterin-guanine dinucleotide biosynthesis protein A
VGVVLAGGASRRLGRDKAVMPAGGAGDAGGETLAARAARRLGEVCRDVALADRARRLVPGLPSLADGPGEGPAAGILGAARGYPGRALLVLACDLPEVPPGLLAELAADPADWAVPRWAGRLEPLCALYRPAALAALAAAVAAGDLALHHLAASPGLAVGYLDGDRLARHAPGGDPAELFVNLNDPKDLAHWLAR